jgi:hypothetical protein
MVRFVVKSLVDEEPPRSGRCRGGIGALRALEPPPLFLSPEIANRVMILGVPYRTLTLLLYVATLSVEEPYAGDKSEKRASRSHAAQQFSLPATASKSKFGVTYPSFRHTVSDLLPLQARACSIPTVCNPEALYSYCSCVCYARQKMVVMYY